MVREKLGEGRCGTRRCGHGLISEEIGGTGEGVRVVQLQELAVTEEFSRRWRPYGRFLA